LEWKELGQTAIIDGISDVKIMEENQLIKGRILEGVQRIQISTLPLKEVLHKRGEELVYFTLFLNFRFRGGSRNLNSMGKSK
jgi:hypothetical protein